MLPLVVQSLPMLSQRVTYIRAFLWAMPERCQQVGAAPAAVGAGAEWVQRMQRLAGMP